MDGQQNGPERGVCTSGRGLADAKKERQRMSIIEPTEGVTTPPEKSWNECVPHTGTWTCPLCAEAIPVTLYGRMDGATLRFTDSPWPRADVDWHIEFVHPDGDA